MIIDVYDLEPDDEVSCYFCLHDSAKRHASYRKGEAFLCGADHSPCNGNANYVCKAHLEKNVRIIGNDGCVIRGSDVEKKKGRGT